MTHNYFSTTLIALASAALLGAGCGGNSAPAAPHAPVPIEHAPDAITVEDLFPVGTHVAAKSKTTNRWYSGVISAVDNKNYSVRFDDGTPVEAGYDVNKLARIPGAVHTFVLEQPVVAKWVDGVWYTAAVTALDAGADKNQINVKLHDGYTYTITDPTTILAIGAATEPAPRPVTMPTIPPVETSPTPVLHAANPTTPQQIFALNTKVYAKWRDGSHWYPGKITAFINGTYTVMYDEGDSEMNVPLEGIARAADSPKKLAIGDSVVAQWTDGEWFTAKITASTADGANVTFYDGTETVLPNSALRIPGK